MRFALMGVLLAGISLPALAQEALPPIVVTATRIPQPLETLPATVTVLSAAQLQEQGDTSLADAFSSVPGVDLVQSGGMGQPASLFVRGADSDQVLVLRDGVPVNDGSNPAGAFDFGEDLLGDISKIEIVRGPLSGLYGSNAIGGVVNMITPQGQGVPAGNASVEGGSLATLFGAANVGGSSGMFDYAAGVQTGSTKGFDVTPQRMNYYTGLPDGFRASTGYVNLGVTPIDGTRFGLILRGREAAEGYDNFGFDDPEGTARLNNLFGRLSADTSLFNGAWQSGLVASLTRDDRHYLNPLLASDPTESSEDSTYHGIDELLQWNNRISLAALPAGGIDFGFEHGRQSVAVVSDTSSYGYPYDDEVAAHRDTDAGYVGVVTTIERLTLSANAREEKVGAIGSAFTWRAGGNFALPEIASNLRLSYGTGFEAPSLYDLFGIDSYGYVGNPSLKPERSDETELGLRTELFDHRLSWDVAIFDQHITDLITYVYQPVDTTENIGRARITGIDASITLRPTANTDLVIAATHLDPRDLSDNTPLIRRPRNKVSIIGHWHWEQFTLVPELDYTDRSFDYLYDNGGNYIGTSFGQSGLIADLSAQYQVNPRLMLTATGRNILDSHYEAANGYQVARASFLAGAKITF